MINTAQLRIKLQELEDQIYGLVVNLKVIKDMSEESRTKEQVDIALGNLKVKQQVSMVKANQESNDV